MALQNYELFSCKNKFVIDFVDEDGLTDGDERLLRSESDKLACLEKLKDTYEMLQMFFDMTDSKVYFMLLLVALAQVLRQSAA